MYYVSRLDDYFGRFPVWDWPWDTAWVVYAMTWSVIVIEILVPTFIWFRQTRWAMLLLALVFHFANEYFMNLYLFHWGMLVAWSAFLLPGDLFWRRNVLSSSSENAGRTAHSQAAGRSVLSASADSNIA
jgi:hypothetical protein